MVHQECGVASRRRLGGGGRRTCREDCPRLEGDRGEGGRESRREPRGLEAHGLRPKQLVVSEAPAPTQLVHAIVSAEATRHTICQRVVVEERVGLHKSCEVLRDLKEGPVTLMSSLDDAL